MFQPQSETHCVPLGSNLRANDWAKGDRLCTKAALVTQKLKVAALEDAEARKHFAPLAEGSFDGLMVASCRAWKQVVCQGRTCRVKKDVRCVKACRFGGYSLAKEFPIKEGKGKGLNPRLLKYPYDQKRYREWQQCGKKYCEGRYGAMACKESAMTF